MLDLFRAWLLPVTLVNAALPTRAVADERPAARIGTFYFSGWFQSPWTPPQNWAPIQAIGDRTPLLGWYDPRSVPVMRKQLFWMGQYGISYVAFDWTYSHGEEHVGAPIDAYLGVDQSQVKFALLWANHDEQTTPADVGRITKLWIDRYMRSSKYLRIHGKPVVYIFSFAKFRDDAVASGSSAHAYIVQANMIARQAGLPGLHFIGGVDDSSQPGLTADALAAGLSAISSYNLHRLPRSEQARSPEWWKPTHGYAALDRAYRAQWAAARSLPVPYVVPMTSGWDRRPWGGSDDPLHDRSIGNDAALRDHLAAGRRAIERLGDKSDGLGIICCWNEYGEGSFIEPTLQRGFRALDQVRAVFGSRLNGYRRSSSPAGQVPRGAMTNGVEATRPAAMPKRASK